MMDYKWQRFSFSRHYAAWYVSTSLSGRFWSPDMTFSIEKKLSATALRDTRTQGQTHEQMLTDLDVGLFVCWHLSEAERRDVAPQGEGLGDPSTRVAGVYQVCREREQPARRQPHGPVKTGLCRNLIRTAHHIDVRSVLLVKVKELINDLKSKTNSWCVRLCKPQNSRNWEMT